MSSKASPASMRLWADALRKAFDASFAARGWHRLSKDIYLYDAGTDIYWRVYLSYTSYPFDNIVRVEMHLGIGHERVERLVAQLSGIRFRKGGSKFVAQTAGTNVAWWLANLSAQELHREVLNFIANRNIDEFVHNYMQFFDSYYAPFLRDNLSLEIMLDNLLQYRLEDPSYERTPTILYLLRRYAEAEEQLVAGQCRMLTEPNFREEYDRFAAGLRELIAAATSTTDALT